MRRALPFLAAAAIGASLVLPYLRHNARVLDALVKEALEEQRPVAMDGETVSRVDAFIVPGGVLLLGLGVAILLSALVTPRRWHWIAGIVLFGVAVAIAATWPIRAEVDVLSYAAWGAAAVGGLLMVVTSVIEKKGVTDARSSRPRARCDSRRLRPSSSCLNHRQRRALESVS